MLLGRHFVFAPTNSGRKRTDQLEQGVECRKRICPIVGTEICVHRCDSFSGVTFTKVIRRLASSWQHCHCRHCWRWVLNVDGCPGHTATSQEHCFPNRELTYP